MSDKFSKEIDRLEKQIKKIDSEIALKNREKEKIRQEITLLKLKLKKQQVPVKKNVWKR